MRGLIRALSVLAVASLASAQTQPPNFSGIYLRDPLQGPLILQITQSPDALNVTAIENGESVAKKYRLDGTSTVESYLGYLTKDVVHFKKETLRLDSTILVAPTRSVATLGSPAPYDPLPTSVSESWDLSPDGQLLRIKRKVRFKNGLGDVNVTETYRREPSLDAALKDGHTSSLADQCNWVSLSSQLAGSMAMPSKAARSTKQTKFDGAAYLSATELQQLSRSVFFHADLSGDFFKNLKRFSRGQDIEFRKDSAPISTYGNAVTLIVMPTELESNPYYPEYGMPFGHPARSADLLDLRFMARWLGAVNRDLGEVRGELRTEPWTELREPMRSYRMEIPSAGIPLSDDLEVRIFSADGKEMGCIRNHI